MVVVDENVATREPHVVVAAAESTHKQVRST
jgi:hypothetical protein